MFVTSFVVGPFTVGVYAFVIDALHLSIQHRCACANTSEGRATTAGRIAAKLLKPQDKLDLASHCSTDAFPRTIELKPK